jgi:hypothetical protein
MSEKWGRWLPHQRWNVDQVPCALNPGKEYTYEKKGANRIWIASRKNGDDKREFTLHLMVHLDAEKPQPKPTIIFRGTGKRISKLERDLYDENVIVMFQPKACADTDLCQKWAADWLPKLVNVQEENVLFCDNLGGQTSLPFKKSCGRHNVRVHLLAKIAQMRSRRSMPALGKVRKI